MNRRDARLLVVDDSPSMRRVMRHVLTELGFTQVDEAEDGVQALEHLEATHYDLVISDWYMPRMSGIDLLRHVRAAPALAQLKVLIVTGYVTQEHLVEAAQAGADGFVIKPFIGASLEEKVTALLGSSRTPTPLPMPLHTHR